MKNALTVNVYEVLCESVESGFSMGWRRAHKHSERSEDDYSSPSAEELRNSVLNEIMNSICEKFKFDDDD